MKQRVEKILMIKVLMTELGLKMGYIERKMMSGEAGGGCDKPGYFFHLFKVLNVLHCLYNLESRI